MSFNNVEKNLILQQDISLGTSSEGQTRNGIPVTGKQVRLLGITYDDNETAGIDASKQPYVLQLDSNNNSYSILIPDGSGGWRTLKTHEDTLTFDTRLQLASATDLPIGTVVKTKGCNQPGDGGHGEFDIVANTDIATDDHGVIDLGGKFAVLRKLNGRVIAAQFGASKTGVPSENSAAINRALAFNAGGVVRLTQMYDCSEELLITVSGTTLEGVGQGYLRNLVAYSPSIVKRTSGVRFMGTGTKSVKTRIKYRGSASDANDDPISTGINIQADGVTLQKMMVDLNCDYTDLSPTNYGDNWDAGVFVGSRQDTRLIDVNVGGYWRGASIWLDATRGVNLPELNGYPSTFGAGRDGTVLCRVQTIGGKWGVLSQGPKTKGDLLHFGFQYKQGGRFNFSANPTDGQTITIGTNVLRFSTTKVYPKDVLIGATVADTITNTRNTWESLVNTVFDSVTLVTTATDLEVYQTATTALPLSTTSGSIIVRRL